MEPLADTVWASGLVFARAGAMLMLLPGVGEVGIPPRVRLAFALMFALALGPVLAPDLPPIPDKPLALAGLVGGEVAIGLAFGVIARFLLAAMAVAGQIAGLQTGLAVAQTFDPAQGQQGALFGVFLTVAAIAVLFAADLHHLLIAGVAGTYKLTPAGTPFPTGDFAALALAAAAESFVTGVRIAAPLLVFGLVFYLGLGILSRLMPQAQIFFIAMPSNIMIGIAILAVTIGGGMLVWADTVERFARELG